jgi:hypothetical protein
MLLVCQLWPSIAPHGPEVPNSIWNLPYGLWIAIAHSTDDYVARQQKERNR